MNIKYVNDENICLMFWERSVSKSKNNLILECKDKTVSFKKYESSLVARPNGWYAKYPECIFCLFRDAQNNVYIGDDSNIYSIDDVNSIFWESGIFGRYFLAENREGKKLMEFKYQTAKRYLSRPWELVLDVLAPDDDWGLVSDLPSFVHSTFIMGEFSDSEKMNKLFSDPVKVATN